MTSFSSEIRPSGPNDTPEISCLTELPSMTNKWILQLVRDKFIGYALVRRSFEATIWRLLKKKKRNISNGMSPLNRRHLVDCNLKPIRNNVLKTILTSSYWEREKIFYFLFFDKIYFNTATRLTISTWVNSSKKKGKTIRRSSFINKLFIFIFTHRISVYKIFTKY